MDLGAKWTRMKQDNRRACIVGRSSLIEQSIVDLLLQQPLRERRSVDAIHLPAADRFSLCETATDAMVIL